MQLTQNILFCENPEKKAKKERNHLLFQEKRSIFVLSIRKIRFCVK